jgi:Flp pilus assembly protein TadD
MTLVRLALSALLIALSLPVWSQPTINVPRNEEGAPGSDDNQNGILLMQGITRMQAGRHQEAIFMYFERVAAIYEARYKNTKGKIYSSRSTVETLSYLTGSATRNPETSAVVASPYWAYAHYLKGYALVELGRLVDAKAALDKAIWLSPQNSQFLSELGHIHQVQKDYATALATFTRAEAAARAFSPQEVRNRELTRAWRGMGFSLIEMRRFDQAEALYRKCLEVDGNDRTAERELQHIHQMRTKSAPR